MSGSHRVAICRHVICDRLCHQKIPRSGRSVVDQGIVRGFLTAVRCIEIPIDLQNIINHTSTDRIYSIRRPRIVKQMIITRCINCRSIDIITPITALIHTAILRLPPTPHHSHLGLWVETGVAPDLCERKLHFGRDACTVGCNPVCLHQKGGWHGEARWNK